MKKLLSCIMALICVFIPVPVLAADVTCNNFSVFSLNEDWTYVSTPNTENGVPVIIRDYELSEETINELNNDYDNVYQNNIRIATASRLYNCHSYAWYSQNTNANNYWMDRPSLYYTDGSYNLVEGSPRKGDIICYFNENNSNLHSGIVIEYLSSQSNGMCGSSDTVLVISKWGSGGLYIHNGYKCPYTSFDNGSATTVRYYRRVDHNHSYTNTQITDNTISMKFHKSNCRICFQNIYAPHDWQEVRINPTSILPQYVPGYECKDCGYFTMQNPNIS